MANGLTLAGLDTEGVLPKELVNEIWQKVPEVSAILRVAGTTPAKITGNTIMTSTGDVVAGIVGEGEAKPVVKNTQKLKPFKPVKAAAIMYWSKEARIANPAGYLDTFVGTLTGAVAKAVDVAVIHGKNALTDTVIDGHEYLMQSTNTSELGTKAVKAGGYIADLLEGYTKVIDADADFTGFVAHPRLRPKLLGAVDMQGRPVFQQTVDLSSNMDTVIGLPVAYARAVSGKVGAIADTGLRAVGGDFANSVKVGFVEEINFKRTDVATIIDGSETISLWQRNMEAILVEAIFSWVIRDVNEFALYTDKVTPDVQP